MPEAQYLEYGSETNYCHDSKIKEYATGKMAAAKINLLLSQSEQPYAGVSWAMAQVDAWVAAQKAKRLPKSRLSKKQKTEILSRSKYTKVNKITL